jgi:hypothetical protein
LSGAKEVHVEPFGYDGHACSYRITWKVASASSGVESSTDARTPRRSGSSRAL